MADWSDLGKMSPSDWLGVEDRLLQRDERRRDREDEGFDPARPQPRTHVLGVRTGAVDPFSYPFARGHWVSCTCGWGRPAHANRADAEAEKRSIVWCPLDDRR